MSYRRTQQPGDPGHWKVRIVVPGALLHLASATEPKMQYEANGMIRDARPYGVDAEWLDGEVGDTPGYIDWGQVTAVTWRYTPPVES